MSLEIYLAYLATVFVFFARPPGPSQLLFMAHSMQRGVSKRSVPVMAGDLSANTIQILIAGFGLAAIATSSALFFTIVKWAGVAYLVWLGVKSILSARSGTTDLTPPTPSALFRQGFITSSANPYAIVFFAALFPHFLTPQADLPLQIAILGLTYIVIDGFLLVVLGGLARKAVALFGGQRAKPDQANIRNFHDPSRYHAVADRSRQRQGGGSHMTMLPAQPSAKKLGLVIDLDTCVGCHACVISCKEWNTSAYGAPLSDQDPYGAEPSGAFLNRIHTFEIVPEGGEIIGQEGEARVVHFPKSCLHCEDAPCVTVCPTGASYKRVEDGIVLVDEDKCIGCGLCAWACAYGAREVDIAAGVMKKCTLCVDRIYNERLEEIDRVPSCVRTCPAGARHFGDLGDPTSDVSLLVAERGGFDLMPEQGNKPVNKYLPPREKRALGAGASAPAFTAEDTSGATGLLGWIDRALSGASGKAH